jgi:hypothetical protein
MKTRRIVQQAITGAGRSCLLDSRPAGGAWIAPETERTRALGRLHAFLAEAYAAHAKDGANTATIDVDATIIESTKREALPRRACPLTLAPRLAIRGLCEESS